ncbi:SH3 domain-containing protein [Bacillota bacterium Meth-B3]|nr:SH3 domain-containing protein [Christensenellaceae bacterium]MEA5069906.1 SH3 domain-containing protein [Christensenellaceae bacterium]
MGKKLVALVLSLVLCLAVAAPVALAGTPTTQVVLPSTMGGLNVRSGPGTNYSVAGWAIDGDEISIVKQGATWTKIYVERSGKTGYIRNAYIKELPDQPGEVDPSPEGTAKAGRVTGRGVNLRKGPGTNYAAVATFRSGAKLRIWDESGNWYYVTALTGAKGWISKTYVASGYTMITSARVNLRKSANGELIKTLPSGTQVTVVSITGNWSKVKAGSVSGYLFNNYLR